MPGPVLLVHDDIAAIATVRRLLHREGLETVLATSAADALIAFGHFRPSLVVLAAGVEGGRGKVVLDELALHPDAAQARVILLGQPVEGSQAPAIPFPLDGAHFLEVVRSTLQGEAAVDAWRVLESRGREATPAPVPSEEDWRATAPGEKPLDTALFGDLPPLQASDWGNAVAPEEAPTAIAASDRDATVRAALERAQAEVEAETLAGFALPAGAREELSHEDATHLELRTPLEGAEEIEAEDPGDARGIDAAPEVTQPGFELPTGPAAGDEAPRPVSASAAEARSERPAPREEPQRKAATSEARGQGRAPGAPSRPGAEATAADGALRRELATLRAERDSAIAQRDSAAAERAAAVAARGAALAERDAARAEQEAATAQRDSARAELEAAKGQRDSAVAERDAARAERKTALAARDAAAKERASAVAERDSARAERDSAAAKAASALAERDSAKAERASTLAERDSAVAKAASAIAERDAAKAERDAALADREHAQSSHAAAQAARAARDLELERLRQAQAEAAETQEVLRRELASLRAERDTALAARDAAVSERDAVRSERTSAVADSDASREEARAASARTRSLESELQTQLETVAALEAMVVKGEDEVRQTLEALARAEAELERAREQADQTLKSSLDEREAQASARIHSLEEELTQLRRRLEEAERDAEQQAGASRATNEELRAGIAELQEQRLALAERLSAVEAERDALHRSLDEAAESQSRTQTASAEVTSELGLARSRISELEEALAASQRDAEGAASEKGTLAAEAEQLRDSLEVLEGRYALLQREFERARRGESEAEKRATAIRTQSEAAIEGLRAYAEPLAARIGELEKQLEEVQRSSLEDLARAEATVQECLHALGEARSQASAGAESLARSEARAKAAEAERDQARSGLEALGQKLEEARAAGAEAQARAMNLDAALSAGKQEWEAELAVLRQRVGELEASLEQVRQSLAAREGELGEERTARAQEAEARSELEQSLAEAEAERQRLAAEIARTIIPLVGPGKESWSLAQSGSADAVGLARVVRKLALAEAEVRLELKSAEGLRVLWLRGGRLVAASSGHPEEWLGASAQREGLIDARQQRELALLRAGSDRAVLEAMQARGWVRDAELSPLVRRHFERIALEALSADETAFRIATAAAPEDALVAVGERPLVALLTEGLRRGLPLAEPGTEPFRCAPRLLGRPDFQLFGFTPAERSFVEALDGTATVQALLLATGAKTDAALRALALAEALELVELGPAVAEAELPPPPDVEVQRLSAKWEEIADADYFSVLGLSRSAGAPEVERAFRSLSEEFHPLRFVGHPDARWRVRAEALQGLLKEAAQALADDRLRAEYARNLAD